MKNNMIKLSVISLLTAAILAVPALSRADDPANAPAAAGQTAKHKRAGGVIPFRGTVTAVDTNAMTLTIGKRMFGITSKTRITKDGKPAVLCEIAVGDRVGGAYKKSADGRLEARTIHARKLKPKADAQP